MSENKNEVKEIDLLELFSVIGKGIKNGFLFLLNAVLFLCVFGVQRIHFIIAFVITGGAIGWFFFSSTQRFYSSDLIAQPNGMSSIDMVDYIGDLTYLSKKGNKEGLAYSLKLPDSTASKIKSIEAFHYIDLNGDNIGDYIDFNKSFKSVDTLKKIVADRIYLQVEVFNNNAFSDVKAGIFNYIADNPYLTKLNELRKRELSELILQTNSEIIKLDSLQNVDYFKTENRLDTSNERGLLFLSEKDKRMYYTDKLRLIELKQAYRKELELATAPITIIKDFTHLAIEENPRNTYIFKFGFWFGVLGYLFLLIIKYRKKLSQILLKFRSL